MGYLFIGLALVCFTAQFALNKVYEQSIGQKMFTAFILVFVSNLVGAILLIIFNGFKLQFSAYSFSLAWAYAFVTIVVDVVSILILSLGNLAMYGAFMMIGGMVLPFICGMCFLGDPFSVWKVVGIVLLILFLLLQVKGQMGNESNKRTKKENIKYYVLCVVIFIVNGMFGVISGLQEYNTALKIDSNSFYFYMCVICVLVSLIVLPIMYVKNKKENKKLLGQFLTLKPLYSSIIMGVTMNLGNVLLLWALNTGVPMSSQYPIVSGGTMVFSALCSILIFKEKLKKLEIIAIVLIFLSTFIFLF